MADVDAQSRADNLHIDWNEASFIGRHWLLGDVEVYLQPGTSSGSVVRVSDDQARLFPAVNRNEFFFTIRLPRLHREYVNRAPLLNSAVISSIPPIGAVYSLEEPVRFENAVNPGDWTDITKCYVIMPDQKWIGIDVVAIAREGNRFRVTASLKNDSPLRWVLAYWFTHTDEPFKCRYEPHRGILWLGRGRRLIHFDFIWSEPPDDPIVQLGAAVITNPNWHEPSSSGGVGTLAINVNRRMDYLASR